MPEIAEETPAQESGGTGAEKDYGDPQRLEKLPDRLQRKLHSLLEKAQKRDSFARRREILRVWKNRFFELGFQHCWWDEDNKILQVGPSGMGFTGDDDDADDGGPEQRDIQNYLGYEKSFRSVFCQNAPTVRFQPVDAKNGADITAAQEAAKHKRVVEKFNNPKELQDDVGRLLWTDGSVVAWSDFVFDGQRFGYEEDDDAGITAEELSGETAGQHGGSDLSGQCGMAGPSLDAGGLHQDATGNVAAENTDSDGADVAERTAKGRDVIRLFGALERKAPLSIRDYHRWPYLIISVEDDIATCKAENADIEDEIKPTAARHGSEQLARLARIACSQGASWEGNSQSTFEHLITRDYCWFRKSFFTELGDQKDPDRQELEELYPDGCFVEFIGETYCQSRNENLEEHIKSLQALKMNGQNVPGLGNSLIDPCEMFDDMANMAEEAFKNTIPQKIFRNGILDIEAIREQGNSYGNYIEANPSGKDDVTRPFEDNFFQETPVNPPEQMMGMMAEIQGPLMQFLSGQLAPVMGQSDEHNETAKGISILRDQALGLMSLVWTPFTNWYGEVMVDAIRAGANARPDGAFTTMVNVPGKDKEEPIEISIEDLRDGNIMAAPVVDANFPESWTAKSNRFFGLFTQAGENPLLMKLMAHPDNQVLAKDLVGLEDMEFPDADAVDKQVQEIALLSKQSPIPPSQEELAAAVQGEMAKFQQAQAVAAAGAQAGLPAPQIQPTDEQQLLQQLTQKLTRSSVEVDPICDNHQVEAEECLRWINSPQGQKMKLSQDNQERMGFQNVRLHFLEHKQVMDQQAAQAAQAQMAAAGGPAGGAPQGAGAAAGAA